MEQLLYTIECPDADYPDQFYNWFCDSWSIRNNLMSLDADFDNIVRGAFIEWNYIQRGAVEDDQKYCDVVYNGIKIDCKFSWVKTERENLFPYIKDRYLKKRTEWSSLGINEIHQWSSKVINPTKITYWFKYTVEDGKFHVEKGE